MSFSLTNMWLAFVALTPIVYEPRKPVAPSRQPHERISAGENPVKVWMESRNQTTPDKLALRMQLNGSPHMSVLDLERMAVTPVGEIATQDIIAFCKVMQITPEQMVCYKRREPAPGNILEASIAFLYDKRCASFIGSEFSRSSFMEFAYGYEANNIQIFAAMNTLARAIGQGPKWALSSANAYYDDIERRLDAVDTYLSGNTKMNGLMYSRAENAGSYHKPYFAIMNDRVVVDIPHNGKANVDTASVNAAWLSAFRHWRSSPKTSAFLKATANAYYLTQNAYAIRQIGLYAPTALRAA